MCLSTQALLLFINLLPREIVSQSATEILIEAESGVVVWEHFEEEWCTPAPLVRNARQNDMGLSS